MDIKQLTYFMAVAQEGSYSKAAEKLGVNKVTIYSYLDEVRGKRG